MDVAGNELKSRRRAGEASCAYLPARLASSVSLTPTPPNRREEYIDEGVSHHRRDATKLCFAAHPGDKRQKLVNGLVNLRAKLTLFQNFLEV